MTREEEILTPVLALMEVKRGTKDKLIEAIEIMDYFDVSEEAMQDVLELVMVAMRDEYGD